MGSAEARSLAAQQMRCSGPYPGFTQSSGTSSLVWGSVWPGPSPWAAPMKVRAIRLR